MKLLSRLVLLPIVAGLLVTTVSPVLAAPSSTYAVDLATAHAALVQAQANKAVDILAFSNAFEAYQIAAQTARDNLAAAPANKKLAVIAEGRVSVALAVQAFRDAQAKVAADTLVAQNARYALTAIVQAQ
jgi:hypothetical protein